RFFTLRWPITRQVASASEARRIPGVTALKADAVKPSKPNGTASMQPTTKLRLRRRLRTPRSFSTSTASQRGHGANSTASTRVDQASAEAANAAFSAASLRADETNQPEPVAMTITELVTPPSPLNPQATHS